MLINQLLVTILGMSLLHTASAKPILGWATRQMWQMISGEVKKYPEGKQLVRNVLGLSDYKPPSTPLAVPVVGPPPPAPAAEGSTLKAANPSVASDTSSPSPKHVKVTPTLGHLSLQPVGVVFRSPQMGFLRIRVDITPLHRQLQEVHYHLQQNGYPDIDRGASDLCLSAGEGSFISLHQALISGEGGPVTGQLNATHSGPHVQGHDLQENCTLAHAHLAFLPGKLYYAHDFAMQLLLRQATKCVSSVDQNLLRYTLGKKWGTTVATRDVLGMLGVGGLSLGVVNRFQLDSLQGQMNRVSHQVEALVGEQHLLLG